MKWDNCYLLDIAILENVAFFVMWENSAITGLHAKCGRMLNIMFLVSIMTFFFYQIFVLVPQIKIVTLYDNS